MTEYHIQKRGLATWQYVTWYDDLEQAQKNFNTISKGDTGYSWRLVEVVVIEERLLSDQKQAEPDGNVEAIDAVVIVNGGLKSQNGGVINWGNFDKPEKPISDPWAAKADKLDHGLTGSVWVGNPTSKEKKRVPANEATKLLAEGWVKSGPRSQL